MKWSTLHAGDSNGNFVYSINEKEIKPVSHQNDFEITVTPNLKSEQYILNIVNKTNFRVRQIKNLLDI